MGISSDVYISKEEAIKRVKAKLMYDHELLINSAIKGMDTWDLSSILNQDSDLYYYNIEDSDLNINRVEVIDETGRILVKTDVDVETSMQDDGKTLKIFIEEKDETD